MTCKSCEQWKTIADHAVMSEKFIRRVLKTVRAQCGNRIAHGIILAGLDAAGVD